MSDPKTTAHPDRGNLDRMTQKPAGVLRELAEARRVLSRVIIPPVPPLSSRLRQPGSVGVVASPPASNSIPAAAVACGIQRNQAGEQKVMAEIPTTKAPAFIPHGTIDPRSLCYICGGRLGVFMWTDHRGTADIVTRLTDAALYAGYPNSVLYEQAVDEIRRAREAVARLTIRVNELKAELVEYENGRR